MQGKKPLLWVAVAWSLAFQIDIAAADGSALFDAYCAACHTASGDPRTPTKRQLAFQNPLAILRTLETGVMQVQAKALNQEQKIALVEALTRKKISTYSLPETAYCSSSTAPIDKETAVTWSGWGGNHYSTGFADETITEIQASNVDRLTLKWAFATPGTTQMRSVPTLIGDTLFLGSQEGALYALNKDSGCIHWRLNTAGAIRGGLAVGERGGDVTPLYFADRTGQTYSVNAATGDVIWNNKITDDPLNGVTGGVLFHEGNLFVPITSIEVGVARNPKHACCTSSGGVIAVNAGTGEVIWRMRVTGEPARQVGNAPNGTPMFAPSGAPVWATPTLDAERGLLYIGTGENYSRPTTLTSDAIMALKSETGEVVWSRQATPDDAWHSGCDRMPDTSPCDDVGPDLDFGMAPMITNISRGETAQQLLIAGQKSAVVHAYDPNGKPIWQTRVGKGSALGGIHWGMATDGNRVYVANSDRPAIIRDVNPDTPLAPGMYALDAVTGALLWSQPTPGDRCEGKATPDMRATRGGCLAVNSAAPIVANNLVFAGDLEGHLRAYDVATGDIRWDYDSNQSFNTVNGLEGHGGSLDGPAPVVAGDMLFVNSGYGSFGQKPGNVFLAFALSDEPGNEADDDSTDEQTPRP